MDVLGTETDLLMRLLGAAGLRSKAIAANLANQNTPGYLRREVRFEDSLREALVRAPQSAAAVEPELVVDRDAPTRADGNSVELERELVAMRENRVLYETYTTILASRIDLLQTAIHGGR